MDVFQLLIHYPETASLWSLDWAAHLAASAKFLHAAVTQAPGAGSSEKKGVYEQPIRNLLLVYCNRPPPRLYLVVVLPIP